MSHDDRDQAGGHPNRHPSMLSCLCCPATTKHDAHPSRHDDRARAIDEQLGRSHYVDVVDDPEESEYVVDPHVYVAGRCVRCDVNWLDVGVYPGLDACPGKDDDEPVVYSTTTGEPPVSSHRIEG
ncbi:hypothetical protein [Streptomyces sp. NPDC052042]|uniref:hypothetical protein n=1 Tax=Streptomyces sp. NPDC052042 TaxID=3365683 RepID=UPI0037D1F21E